MQGQAGDPLLTEVSSQIRVLLFAWYLFLTEAVAH